MSVPAFISIDSDRSVASMGVKLLQQVVLDNAVEIYYIDGAIPVRVSTSSPTDRQILYENLLTQLGGSTPPSTRPVLLFCVVASKIKDQADFTIDIYGTNFTNNTPVIELFSGGAITDGGETYTGGAQTALTSYTYISSTQMQATVGATDVNDPGTAYAARYSDANNNSLIIPNFFVCYTS